MTDSRPGLFRKWLFIAVFVLAVVFLALSWLPSFIEQSIIPRVLAKSGLNGYQVAVQHIGLVGCGLQLTARPDAFPVVTAGNISIDWSWRRLLQRRLDSVVVDGLQVHHYVSNTEDRDAQRAFPAHPSVKNSRHDSAGPPPLPIVVDAITLSNSTLFVHASDCIRRLPFSLSGKLDEKQAADGSGHTGYEIEADLAGQDFKVNVSYSPVPGVLVGDVTGIMDLQQVSRLFNVPPGSGSLSGRAEVMIESEMRFSPFSLENVQVRLRSDDLLFNNNNFTVKADTETGSHVIVSGTGYRFQVVGSGFAIDQPIKATIDFASQVDLAEEGKVHWQGNGTVVAAPGQKLGNGIVVLNIPPVALAYDGSVENRDVFLNVTASNQADAPEKHLEIVREGLHLSLDGFLIETQYNRQSDQEIASTVSVLFQGEQIQIKGPGVHAGVPRLSFSGTGKQVLLSDWKNSTFSGGLLVEDGSLEIEKQGVRVENILLDLPVNWPWHENNRKGDIRVDHISMHEAEFGEIHAELLQAPSALGFVGELNSRFLPEDTIGFNGVFRVPSNRSPLVELSWRVENAQVAMENFQPLVAALKDVTGNGLMDMSADFVLYRDRFDGQLEVEVKDGDLALPSINLAVEDVNVKLHFPDLPTLRSSPEQKLSIGTITSKNIRVVDLNTVFQVESPQSFFVEKIGGRWSGGRVFTSSFRLHKDKPELEFALFCDRLELAEILSQLNLADAEGSGKVSGRIPLLYRHKEIFVDDGFLFSTPGETGSLKIEKSEQLTAGIPDNVPHFSPIHFAGAALRDFEYNWAKLLLVSKDENLVLKLQIDGKPAKPLPYRFDSTKNIFVKMGDRESGGIDQPIKLDVNFNVPLNELLQYQTTILPILRNLK